MQRGVGRQGRRERCLRRGHQLQSCFMRLTAGDELRSLAVTSYARPLPTTPKTKRVPRSVSSEVHPPYGNRDRLSVYSRIHAEAALPGNTARPATTIPLPAELNGFQRIPAQCARPVRGTPAVDRAASDGSNSILRDSNMIDKRPLSIRT